MDRILPQPTPETRHFWDGCKAGELRLQRCMACEKSYFPPRPFCPACGSPVYLTFAALPDLFTVHAASLDDPSRFAPQVVTYGIRGFDWDVLDPALPKFEKMPTG